MRERYDRAARFTLKVSSRMAEVEMDLRTEVASLITAKTDVET